MPPLLTTPESLLTSLKLSCSPTNPHGMIVSRSYRFSSLQKKEKRILLEARKLVPDPKGDSTTNPAFIDAFPLTQLEWDYNTGAAGGAS